MAWNYASIPPNLLGGIDTNGKNGTNGESSLAFEDLISEGSCGPASGSGPPPKPPILPYYDLSSRAAFSSMGEGDPMTLDAQYSYALESPPIAQAQSNNQSAFSSLAASPEADKRSTSSDDVSAETHDGLEQVKLIILGIPEEGMRTRVETQMKVTFLLVHRDPNTNSLARVTLWKYLKLPAYTALKRKNKRHFKAGVTPEEALHVEVHVVKSSNPTEEVFICANCQERERKRSQRKKEARIKPAQDVESDSDNAEDAKRLTSDDSDVRRIILFNCGEYIDFAVGEVTVPVRVACYCRHHKEKDGFLVKMILRDHNGKEIASATSPKILTTDDHKAKPRFGRNDSSTSISRNASLESLASLAESVDSAHSTNAATPTAKRAPRRSNSSFSLTSMSEALQPDNGPGKAASARQRPESKPYDTGRPLKRNSLSRSSMFSMTPMNSPPRRASPDLPTVGIPSFGLPSEANADLQAFSAQGISPSLLTSSISPPTFTHSANLPSSMNDTNSNAFGMHVNNGFPNYLSSDATLYSPPDQTQEISSSRQASLSPPGLPFIDRMIPSEGPLVGGTEVTLLGKNFNQNTRVFFGSLPATSTTLWSTSSMICIAPTAAFAGAVPITLSTSHLIAPSPALNSPHFNYVDGTDGSLMELALQIVGMRSSGRLENANDIARRIIGSASAPVGPTLDSYSTGVSGDVKPELFQLEDWHS